MNFQSWANWHVFASEPQALDVDAFQLRFPSLQQGAKRWLSFTQSRPRAPSHPRPFGFSALIASANSMDEVVKTARSYFSIRDKALDFLRHLPIRHELEFAVEVAAPLVTYGFFEEDFAWIAKAGFVLRFTAVGPGLRSSTGDEGPLSESGPSGELR